MRPIALSAAALLVAAASARAACSDTLYLQSLTVYSQSLKNTTTLGTWDSVVVNAWDSAEAVKAAPLTLTPYEGLFLNPFDTVDHELQFSSNCGTDSVGPVVSVRLTSDTVSTGTYAWKSIVSSQQVESTAKVTWKWIRSGAYQWKVGTETLWANDVWDADDFTLASDTVGQTIVGWKGRSLGFAIRPSKIYGSGYDPYPQVEISANSRMEAPFRKQVENYFTGTILPAAQVSVDSIGKGSIDSTRIELRMYKSVFAKQTPTGVRSAVARSAAFSVVSGSQGWSIALPRAASLSIVGLDGRTVRTFASTSSVLWDGRDASGAKVHPGIWYVHAQGIGSTPLLVR